MISVLVAFLVSALLTYLVVRSAHHHSHLSGDSDTTGPQKFHSGSVPRIGGIGIVGGLVAALSSQWQAHPDVVKLAALLLCCGAPAFIVGMAEDIFKNVSPRRRLVVTAFAAGLGVWLLDATIDRTGIPGLDWVVSLAFGAALVTVFVVAGVANAFNIIDGFNGLSSLCVAMALGTIAFVSFEVNDEALLLCALAGIGAVLGFFVWNFPFGKIFLGDGGAYFLGFYVAELAILLLHRHPTVSPLFPLLVCIYPVFETVFSIYRKKFIRGMSPGVPDGVHLHMLIYKRIVRAPADTDAPQQQSLRNSMTSPYLWVLCAGSLLPAMLFWESTVAMSTSILAFGFIYTLIYWQIVRFRVPRWLPSGRRRPATTKG